VWPAVLLAKEVAAIDGVSGGRLTLGVGIGGNRADDYVVEGLPSRRLGTRMDADLETYHRVWRGEPVGGGTSPAVPAGTRPVPMVFGGTAPKALRRMAGWGAGYIAGSIPATMVTPMFDAARDAWREGGRTGSPRLIALAYYALDDIERARANAGDYYAASGTDTATVVLDTMSHTPTAIRAVITSFADIGATELVFMPATDDIAEVDRLAEIAL
jgi:alkanesulfonate monooxygenase SsuD/methylene tetrahydromethanopterin reductase-like flavin-dependent oxidoreductase (luciferase family)